MKIFFDTEFTGLHQYTTLISIGLVAEDEREFYAEFTDYDKAQIDNWLQENIIDKLTLEPLGKPNTPTIWPVNYFCGNKDRIRFELNKWLTQFGEIEFWSDCLSYDWVLLSELIADRSSGYPVYPDNFAYHSPYDILTVMKIKGIDPDVAREDVAFADEKQEQGIIDKYVQINKHNSLWDAQVIKACYKKLVRL